jgi:hypothetical protein
MRVRDLFDKANVLPIVQAHADTMSSYRTGRPLVSDYLFFFGFPVLLGGALLAFRFGFRVDAVMGFLNAFAILTGLMLNMLVLVFSISVSISESNRTDMGVRRRVLKEIFTNVCYCIIVAVGATLTSLVALSYMRSQAGAKTGPIATFLLTSLTANFALCLMMILKRMYKLLSNEFDMAGRKAA